MEEVITSISAIPPPSRGALRLVAKWVSLLPGELEDCVVATRRERTSNSINSLLNCCSLYNEWVDNFCVGGVSVEPISGRGSLSLHSKPRQ